MISNVPVRFGDLYHGSQSPGPRAQRNLNIPGSLALVEDDDDILSAFQSPKHHAKTSRVQVLRQSSLAKLAQEPQIWDMRPGMRDTQVTCSL
jgi:hypothetical protein